MNGHQFTELLPYYGIFSWTLLWALFLTNEQRSKTGSKAAAWAIIAVPLMLFAGLRQDVGTDFQTYQRLSRNINPEYWRHYLGTSPQESGYVIFVAIVNRLGWIPNGTFLVSSIIIVSLVFHRITQMPRETWLISISLFILLGGYLFFFNAQRQGIAVALLFWGEKYCRQRRTLPVFLVTAALAYSMHSSAIVPAAIIMLSHISQLRPAVAWVAFVAPIFLLIVTSATDSLVQIAGGVNERYARYDSTAAQGTGVVLMIALRLAMLLIAYYLPHEAVSPQLAVWSFGLIFMAMGIESTVSFRLEAYFGIFMLPVLSHQLHGSRHMTSLLILTGIGFSTMSLLFYGDLLPYQNMMTGDLQ